MTIADKLFQGPFLATTRIESFIAHKHSRDALKNNGIFTLGDWARLSDEDIERKNASNRLLQQHKRKQQLERRRHNDGSRVISASLVKVMDEALDRSGLGARNKAAAVYDLNTQIADILYLNGKIKKALSSHDIHTVGDWQRLSDQAIEDVNKRLPEKLQAKRGRKNNFKITDNIIREMDRILLSSNLPARESTLEWSGPKRDDSVPYVMAPPMQVEIPNPDTVGSIRLNEKNYFTRMLRTKRIPNPKDYLGR